MSKQEELQKELDEQRKNFIEDESYFEQFENFEPLHHDVFVKIFKFTPDSSGMSSPIIMPDAQGNWKTSTKVIKERFYPIVKIIKVGEKVKKDFNIKVGEIYSVPEKDIVGESWNPDFLHLAQSFQMKGAKVINIPDNMRQRLPNIELRWEPYLFKESWKTVDNDEEDNEYYLIPVSKIRAKARL